LGSYPGRQKRGDVQIQFGNILEAGSRGGPNRGRIINLLRREPYNINKLAEALHVHYRVAEHHIRALEKNHLVSSAGEKYGKLYFLSPEMEAHLPLFDEIWAQIRPRV